ncbi:MAG: ClpXP protease specificity-enhancing factor SspB [Oceanococcaceae bacterium]
MIPRKPYLITALCDWAEDNGWTPMLVITADLPGVQVPRAQVKDGKITLNISQQATREREITAHGLHALARFAGEIQRLRVPLDAIDAFVVRETGEGMLFPPEPVVTAPAADDDEASPHRPEPTADDPPPSPGGKATPGRRNHLTVIK